MVNSYLYLYTVCSVTHAALTVILNLSENIPFITDVYLTATWSICTGVTVGVPALK